MKSEGVRLQKFLAMSGIGSRRECEQLIRDGKVKIKGVNQVSLGIRVDPVRDVVTFQGKRVKCLEQESFLFHKPRGFTCNKDPKYPDKSILEFDPDLKKYPVVVGLERMSSGLILLSNDGELHQSVKNNHRWLERKFQIRVKEKLDDKLLAKLRRVKTWNNLSYKIEKIRYLKMDQANHWYELVSMDHRDKMLSQVFMDLGHPIQRCVQVGIAGIQDGLLRKGKGRKLTFKEIEHLQQMVGQ